MLSKTFMMGVAFSLLAMGTESNKETMVPAGTFSGVKNPSSLTLFLCGDVMTGRGIDQILPYSVDSRIYESYVKNAKDYVRLAERVNGPVPRQVSYSYIWGDALEVWKTVAPDLKIINLETSITTHAEPWPEKVVQYRMHPENTTLFTTAGIDFCSLANNHTLDWKRPGLLETMRSLTKAEITYAGAGQDKEEASEPALLSTGKGRVIVLAYGSETSGIPGEWAATVEQSGINLLPDSSEAAVEVIKQQVKRVKQEGDVVVFTVHWGSNWGYDIPPARQDFARRLIDEAGVDIIHGHSSHHPLGIEVYKGRLILYGAGDFINDYEGIRGHEQYRADLSLMYFPEIDPASGKLTSMKMVPMQIRNLRLNYTSPEDREWLRKVLDRESRKFGTGVIQNEDGSFSLHW